MNYFSKLITRYDLRLLTLAELLVLHRELVRMLAQTAYGSASRRNCLASLENTIREINARYAYQLNLGAGL